MTTTKTSVIKAAKIAGREWAASYIQRYPGMHRLDPDAPYSYLEHDAGSLCSVAGVLEADGNDVFDRSGLPHEVGAIFMEAYEKAALSYKV